MTETVGSSSPIPIVEFGKFLRGNAKERKEAASEIDEAFRTVGFVYLKNHGVKKQRVDECFEWSSKFFALPTATKLLAPHPLGSSHHRGYSGLGVEKVSQNVVSGTELQALRAVPDVKESFESGNMSDASQPNIWLPEPVLPGFRVFMESFFTDCDHLVHALLDALSLALDVPSPGLSPTHSQSLFQLRLLHYPALPARLLKEQAKSRIAAHSDFGTLTLLFQDAVGGLEVQDPLVPGTFRPAPPIEGTVLVNIGDLMERWSNERWRSTVHRVGAPPVISSTGREEGEEEIFKPRYSIPFFATADMETVIEALPGCWGEDKPKKFEPVTAWGYVQMRMAALYS